MKQFSSIYYGINEIQRNNNLVFHVPGYLNVNTVLPTGFFADWCQNVDLITSPGEEEIIVRPRMSKNEIVILAA